MHRLTQYCIPWFLILLLAGCKETPRENTGGISVRLIWPSPAEWQSVMPRTSAQTRASLPDRLETVRFRVSAADINTIEQDFPAADRRGSISGIPAGSNRTLTMQALDNGGTLLADCAKTSLLIEAGRTTQAGDCVFEVVDGNEPPTVNAGADQTVASGAAVALSAEGSDSDGDIVAYRWTQTSGAAVTLSTTADAITGFDAPSVTEAATLAFTVTVTDNDGATGEDSVVITVTAEVIEPFEPEMISLSGGCFDMGSPEDEPDRDSDETLHNVCVDDFAMGKHEISHAEYVVFLNEQGRSPDRDNEPWIDVQSEDEDSHILQNGDTFSVEAGFEAYPVIEVSWYGAIAYAEWLSNKTGKAYRLPTEAEWEYAARAGTSTPYSYGSDIAKLCQYGNGRDEEYKSQTDTTSEIAPCNDGYYRTAPVGQFDANPWGLHDMHGNVREWSCSQYVSDYDGSEKVCLSKNDAADKWRVLRGGSWSNDPRYLRSANRSWVGADGRSSSGGFRVARTLTP